MMETKISVADAAPQTVQSVKNILDFIKNLSIHFRVTYWCNYASNHWGSRMILI